MVKESLIMKMMGIKILLQMTLVMILAMKDVGHHLFYRIMAPMRSIKLPC